MKFIWDRGGYRAALAVECAMAAGIILFIGLAALETSAATHQEPRRLTAALAAFVGAFLALPYLSFVRSRSHSCCWRSPRGFSPAIVEPVNRPTLSGFWFL